jgi:hypothetical protein
MPDWNTEWFNPQEHQRKQVLKELKRERKQKQREKILKEGGLAKEHLETEERYKFLEERMDDME